jgi:inositol 1,4,5-triphosphate receptor type 1/inositol 1,4,5-triphosphate receptor type 3
VWCKKALNACWTLLKEVDVLFYLLYLVFSILGTIFNPLFFAFHLLDVLYRFPSLQNVIKSITTPRWPLLLSFIFLLIIVYFFSIVGYTYLYNDFEAGQCENLFNCFCQVFDKGFKSDGGIGGYLRDWTPGEINLGRLFYDNACNILIIIIMMNIVQGLTVDTFALLRKEHEVNTKDRENKCFICGLEKETIERATSRPFKFHTELDHNEWKYVHFVGYLQDKETTEYTGIESYVVEKVDNKDVSWFPQQEALSIKSQENDKDAVMLRESEEVKSAVKEMQQDIKEVSKNLDAGLFAQPT